MTQHWPPFPTKAHEALPYYDAPRPMKEKTQKRHPTPTLDNNQTTMQLCQKPAESNYSQKLEAKVLPGYKTLILRIMTNHQHLWHNHECTIATHGTTFFSAASPITPAGKLTNSEWQASHDDISEVAGERNWQNQTMLQNKPVHNSQRTIAELPHPVPHNHQPSWTQQHQPFKKNPKTSGSQPIGSKHIGGINVYNDGIHTYSVAALPARNKQKQQRKSNNSCWAQNTNSEWIFIFLPTSQIRRSMWVRGTGSIPNETT